MAKKIKHASKGEIVFLSTGSYDQLHTSILQTLGKNAPFAPVSISTTTVAWDNNSPFEFKSVADAPEEIRGELMLLFEQLSQQWAEALKRQRLEYVLTVPDASYIFYAVNTGDNDNVLANKYRFLITGWACKFNKSADVPDGLKRAIIEARERHQNVIVEMLDGYGAPIANGQFTYSFNNSVTRDITTDANGCYEQGICLIGSEYRFRYNLTGQERVLKVEKNIELYTLKFAPTTTINISLVDQFNKPVSSVNTDIKYGSIHLTKLTDGYGRITLTDVLYDDPTKRVVITPEGYSGQDFAVACPTCDITMVVNVAPPVKPYLLVRVGGMPAANLTVDFSGAFSGAYATDSEGKIALPDLLPGHSFAAVVTRGSQVDDATFTVIAGRTEYVLDLPELETTPDPEKPVPFDCHIVVKAIEDGTPLANYSLKIESDMVDGLFITDSNGVVPIGRQIPGNTLRVLVGKDQADIKDITIEAGKDEYVIYVDKPLVVVKDPDHEIAQDCHIKVLSKITGLPVPNYALTIDSPRMQGNYSTDENGIVELQNMTVGVAVTVTPGKHDPVQFDIEQYREEYVIQVDDSQTVKGDILITQCEKDEKTPIPNATITLTNSKGQKITKTTDASGNIVVPRTFFTDGEKVQVHLDIPNRKVRDFSFKFTNSCDHYLLHLTEPFNWKKLLYLLIPLLLLLLCMVQCDRDITVRTVDTQNRPVPQCNVELAYTEHALVKNWEIDYSRYHTLDGVTDKSVYISSGVRPAACILMCFMLSTRRMSQQ